MICVLSGGRAEVWAGWHNLLPFSTPQSYALLSAESKGTHAANNKERPGVCHDAVWCYKNCVCVFVLFFLRLADGLWNRWEVLGS
jgi:hypothetical protein